MVTKIVHLLRGVFNGPCFSGIALLPMRRNTMIREDEGNRLGILTFNLRLVTVTALVLVGLVASSIDVSAQRTSASVADGRSIYDEIWDHATIYNNPDGDFIQSVSLPGRYQMDYTMLDSADYDRFKNRRWRMGAKIKFLENFTLHTEVDLDHDADPLYRRLTDAYLAWQPSKSFKLTIGKHGAPFTMDGQTSSKELIAIDRSNLSNNMWFTREYMPGVSMKGTHNQWVYHVGLYSSGSASQEFGNFDGKGFFLGTIGYDFSTVFESDKALLRLNYVYQEEDGDNGFTRNLQNVVSLNFHYEKGKWGLRADLTGAEGYRTRSDLWGFTAMPYYNLTENLQAVLRYTFVSSDDPNGVRIGRYENRVIPGRGDEYNEVYAGLNYYIYGHKLKLQTGVQYADMNDNAGDGGGYRGVAWTTGLRSAW